MKRLFLLSCVAVVGACGGDPACVLDTDCPLGRYCSAEQRCVDLGGGDDAGPIDAGPEEDAGEPVDSGPMDAGVDGGPVQVGVGNVVASSSPTGYFVSASFFETSGTTSPCTVTEPSESCRLTACPPPVMMEDAGVPMDAGMPVAPNAGIISITGGVTEEVTLTPGADGLYPPATGVAALWMNPATLNVMGAGADAPMFGVTLGAPETVTLTAPATGPAPVASDLAVTWTGSTPGDVVVVVSAVREGTFTLECRFEPSSGTGTVPSAALGAMGAGAAFLAMRSEQSRAISRTGWDISVALQAPGSTVSLTLE